MKRLFIILCTVVVLSVPLFQNVSLDVHASSVEGSVGMYDGGIDPDDPGFHGDLGDDPDPFGETSVSSSVQSDPEPEQSDPEPEQSDPEPEQSDSEPEQSDTDVLILLLFAVSVILGLDIGRAFSFWKW